MVQHIYLIRHGKPEFQGSGSYCIGCRTDIPLSDTGRRQAVAWKGCFDFADVLWCSPLRRSFETAELAVSDDIPVRKEESLTEVDVGDWEGLSFQKIRERYPCLYATRGQDWSVPPLNGETLEHAAGRMQWVLLELLGKTKGDVVAVSHEGSIRALMQRLMQLDTRSDAMFRQPYGSMSVLRYAEGLFAVTAVGKLPDDVPSDKEIEEMWDICSTPRNVRNHCRAVCDECLRICDRLASAGVSLDREVLRAAALLHDTCRTTGRIHADAAAALLRERGYMKIAGLVEMHQNEACVTPVIHEAGILYLSDKLIMGDDEVTLQERFTKSLERCKTPEAKQKHKERFDAAVCIQNDIEKLIKRWETKP